MKLSIEMNGVYVPFNQVIEAWRRHCYPLLHYIPDSQGLDLGYAGSSLLLCHRGQLLQLFSNHQLENLGIDATDVLIYRDELTDEKALGPMEIVTSTVDDVSHENLNDIKIIRYASQREPDALAARFFRNDVSSMQTLEETDPDQVVLIFTVGFPLRNGRVEGDFNDESFEFENAHVFSASTKIYSQKADPIKIDPDNRLPLEIHDDFEVPPGYDFNGFSGAPVFFIWQDTEQNAHLGFAGMVTEVLFDSRLELYPGSKIQDILRRL